MFLKDKRIKNCWNPKCKDHRKHVKYSSKDQYCTRCGTELVLVCKKCGGLLEDTGRKHRVCDTCIARKEAGKEARKEATASVLQATAAIGNTVADKIANKK